MDKSNAVVLMSRERAQEINRALKLGLSNMGDLLLEMRELEGWRALDFRSWREYAEAELGLSVTRVYQLANAAKVTRNIAPVIEPEKLPAPKTTKTTPDSTSVSTSFSTIVEKPATPIPESHLRPLTKLTPDQQRAAWLQAQATARAQGVNTTAKHVQQAANQIRSATKPTPSHHSASFGTDPLALALQQVYTSGKWKRTHSTFLDWFDEWVSATRESLEQAQSEL